MNSNIETIEQLRNAAKAQPINAVLLNEAADAIERIQKTEQRYESLIKNGLICSSCGGSGFLGNPPDDYYDCPECAKSVNKIKVEAAKPYKEVIDCLLSVDHEYGGSLGADGCFYYKVSERVFEKAEKLKRGEL